MAKAIDYAPAAPDRIGKNTCRLEAGLAEHADAMLAAIALLEEAHQKQVLDLLHGAIGAKSSLFSVIADLGSETASVNMVRNLIVLGKTLGAVDPELVSKALTNIRTTLAARTRRNDAPSLRQLFKQANRSDVRRGISFALEMAGALGRAVE